MNYKYIDHTADIGIEAIADNLEKLFQNLLTGVIRIYNCQRKIDELHREKFEVDGENLDELLFNCVDRLIYIIEVERYFPVEISVNKIGKINNHYRLVGLTKRVKIDKISSFDHVIKAPTYHQLAVKPHQKGYWGRIIVDV